MTDTDSAISDTQPRPGSGILAGNRGKPIKLKNVQLDGVAAAHSRAGDKASFWTRLAITSADPLFHRIAANFARTISHYAQQCGEAVSIDNANTVLLVIHPGGDADLWIDAAVVTVDVRLKKSVATGTPIFERDIADILGMWFPFVDIKPEDRIFCLFREHWRFAIYFDFNPDGNLAVADAKRTLGSLLRGLRYRHLYDAVANETLLELLRTAGWFPFVEIVTGEFGDLALAAQAGFDLQPTEAVILSSFDEERLDGMLERWLAKPVFKTKEALLAAAISAYKAGNPVAVLKIVLTEIEGILRAAHVEATGKPAKLKVLLEFVTQSASDRSGGSDTLMFPEAFGRYLHQATFANFDPEGALGSARSRHAVGHGAAAAESYTMTAALQALLTLDQLAFYL